MLAEAGFGSAVVVVCKYVCSLVVSMYNIFCCTEYTSGGWWIPLVLLDKGISEVDLKNKSWVSLYIDDTDKRIL